MADEAEARTQLDRRLFMAASGGRADEVRALFRMGAGCGYRDSESGNTALHEAVLKGYTPAALAVLNCAPSFELVTFRNHAGHTALHSAVEHGNEEIIKALVQQVGNRIMNLKDTMGNNCLHTALHNGRYDLLRELLREGCDPTAANERGNTPLHIAAGRGEEDGVADLLFAGTAIDHRNGAGRTALHVAAEEGHTNICRFLLQHGASVDVADAHGLTAIGAAIHGTCDKSRLRTITQLLEHGANPNSSRATGTTCLHDAAMRNQVDIVKCLIAKGATVNVSNVWGFTPLHSAAKEGAAAAVQVLLDHGADVNRADEQHGRTALTLAAAMNHFPVVKLLLAHGADPTTIDRRGICPVGHAIMSGAYDVSNELVLSCRALAQGERNLVGAMTLACRLKRRDFAVALARTGVNLFQADSEGATTAELLKSQKGWAPYVAAISAENAWGRRSAAVLAFDNYHSTH